MPGGDCTGPWWTGSRANRAGYSGYYKPRRRCRRTSGYGIGYAYEPFRQPAPEEERSYLEAVARDLEEELKSVRDQIEKLRSRA